MDFQAELISLLGTLVVGLFGWLVNQATGYLKKKGVLTQLENNKELVKIAVNAVEQAHNNLGGNEKFNLAKMEVIKLLQSKNIKMTEQEMDLFIEAMVKEMREQTKAVMSQSDSNQPLG